MKSNRYPCLLVFAWSLLTTLVAESALPVGTGDFTFTRPCDGKAIAAYYVKSPKYRAGDPPVIVFHGMLRNPDVYRDAWIKLAKKYGLFVVVPLFSQETYPGTNGYNLGNIFVSERSTTRNPECLWSYRIPADLFNFLRANDETSAEGYMAFGHSAGSQFLHRQIAFRPDPRLLLAIAANAGWYTFPDFSQTWPYGFADTGLTASAFRGFLGSNLFLLLGEADNDPNHKSLRRTPEAMQQGKHRFERGQHFYAAGKALAERHQVPFAWQIETVPRVDHNNARMAPAAAKIMAQFIEKQHTVPPLTEAE